MPHFALNFLPGMSVYMITNIIIRCQKLKRKERTMAICPYCEKSVTLEAAGKDSNDEISKEVEGLVKREVMYFCPHCQKILGFAFFFGGRITGRP